MTTTRPPETRLLDRETAASFLGVGTRTFDKLCEDHEILAPIRFGRRCLWDVAVLHKWVDTLALADFPAPEDLYQW